MDNGGLLTTRVAPVERSTAVIFLNNISREHKLLLNQLEPSTFIFVIKVLLSGS